MRHYIQIIAEIIEGLGVAILLLGVVYSLVDFFISKYKGKEDCYFRLRKTLGKFILLGLEVLIAADIIATVNTNPTLESVTILGIIVLIRTFLSLSIQVEIEGRFPWQKTSQNVFHKDSKE
ncbi:DUF1622 domain-containing protein [Winogradskyella maritima]|uniref:DUF1622 domain-containing protein n=1 Tax=Winogradskyella maritima TaxID=1517766 RepID=A0ABV8AJQ6_9FLAO|nr:DUF1622 domain-containing protein [Winogradskyella maritima]